VVVSFEIGGLHNAIRAVPRNSQIVKSLIERGFVARYLAGGRLLYYQDGALFGAPMDPNRLELTGPAVPLVDGVNFDTYWGPAFDASTGGIVVYRRDLVGINRRIAWLDANGQIEFVSDKPGGYIQPRLAPDGKRLALTIDQEGKRSVWVCDLARKTMTRLGMDPSQQDNPVWTPDGAYLLFHSGQTLGWMRSDGSGAIERLKGDGQDITPEEVSPDGRWILFDRVGQTGDGSGLWQAKLEFSAGMLALIDPKPLPGHKNHANFRISPDGRWLAYSALLEASRGRSSSRASRQMAQAALNGRRQFKVDPIRRGPAPDSGYSSGLWMGTSW